MKRSIKLIVLFISVTQFSNAQYVGIGTTTPTHPLTVVSSGNGIVSKSGSVEVGTYVDASSAWLQTYSNNPLYFSTNNGSIQISLLTNGNMGIGVATPAYKLDVLGTLHTTGDITAGSDVIATGDLTVQGGKGIIRASNGTQLKHYSRSAHFGITLGAFGSFDSNINFTSGIFASPPRVFVGDIVAGTESGEFQKLQLVIFNTTPTGCSVRLYNNSNATITAAGDWSIMCIGN